MSQSLSLFEDLQMFDRTELLLKLKRLMSLYSTGQLGGTTHEVHPDLERDSVENYLYFTLAPALNFQRKSEQLWQAALHTFSDAETAFVFSPELVSRSSEQQLHVALTKHRLAVLGNKHTWIWGTLCRTLHSYYGDDPRELLGSCHYDVTQVRGLLCSKKEWFPYLSGPKLSNYWLYILSHFTDVALVNRDEISVIPDSHVMRATQYLGLVPTGNVSADQVAKIWKEVLLGTEISPADLHAPLWRWSRKGFDPPI